MPKPQYVKSRLHRAKQSGQGYTEIAAYIPEGVMETIDAIKKARKAKNRGQVIEYLVSQWREQL